MVKLYFLGGEDTSKRDSKEINEKAFASAGETPNVLIFNWTAEYVNRTGKYRKEMATYFRDLGASKIQFAGLSDSLLTVKKKIERSDLIYLPGGNTRILVQRIQKANVDNLLRKYDKVIVGNSAGALALCRDCILMKGKDNPTTRIITGLGLVNFSVGVHYTASMDEEMRRLSLERRIYAIPERSALVHENVTLSFIGDVYLFHKGTKKVPTTEVSLEIP